jgi:hypothetical protein
MNEVDQTKSAVEGLHKCPTRFAQSVPVSETFGANIVWTRRPNQQLAFGAMGFIRVVHDTGATARCPPVG